MNARPAALVLLAALLLLFAPGFVSPAEAAEKSYTLPRVEIKAAVTPAGALTVQESRTWAFTGSYTWVQQWVKHPAGFRLADVSISESGKTYVENASGQPGTFRVTREAERTSIKWYFQANDVSKVFVLRYTVPDAVTVHNDVAELYWQWVGTDWKVTTQHTTVDLRLPPGAARDAVRAWGHGPLQGVVAIPAGEQVTWQVDGLSAGTFLEGRTVFPTSLVPQATRKTGKVALSAILQEEGAWAAEANRRRDLAGYDALGGVALFLVGLIAVLLIWWRLGRDPKSGFRGPYYRELPGEYSPAELGVLWRKNQSVGGPELAATLLDLARRGLVTLNVVPGEKKHWFSFGKGEDLAITRADGSGGIGAGRSEGKTLAPHEQALLDFLFQRVAAAPDRLLVSELPVWARRDPQAMRKFLLDWRRGLSQAGEQRVFWDPGNRRRRIIGYVIYAALILAGVTGLVLTPLTITSVVLVVLAAIGMPTVVRWQRRSPAGAEDFRKWKAFRHFLTDFSRLDLAQVPALILWEHYLVYATVLGVAKETLHQMKAILPRLPEADRLAWERDRMFMYGPFAAGAGLDHLSRVSDAFGSSFHSALGTTRSSGAGSGGGFSGGGGGGIGGGGGDAG